MGNRPDSGNGFDNGTDSSAKIRTSMILSVVIGSIVLSRAIFVIILPYNNAQVLYDKDAVVTGIVESFIPENEPNAVFSNDLLIGPLAQQDETEQPYKSILIKTRYGLVSFYCTAKDLDYGDRIRVNLHFSQPFPVRNPGGFDERQYYYSNGIFLKGTLVNRIEPFVISKSSISVYQIAYTARSRIMRIFSKNLPPREAGLMSGLLLGDRSGMSKEDLKCYQKAGLSHMTAVSGSAITFLLIPLEAVLVYVKIAKRKKSVLKFGVLFFFGFITGWTPSISRALIMVFILMSARELHQKIKITQALFIAIPILLIVSPCFALNIGFWLSCIATTGIVMISRSIEKMLSREYDIPKIIKSALSMSIAAGISVMPLVIWVSKEMSLSSIVSGIFVLPLVEFTTIFGSGEALLGILNENYFLTKLFAIPLKGLLYSIFRIASAIAGIDFLHIRSSDVSFYFVLAISAFVIYLFLAEKKKKRTCFFVAICVLLTGVIHTGIKTVLKPEIQIVFADVGQGDSTLIRLRTGESILIDSGGKAKGLEVMRQMLDFYSIDHPSIYIATHTHEDHCGGMVELIRERGGTILFVPYNTINKVENNKIVNNPSVEAGSASLSTSITGESDMGEELISAAHDKNMQIMEVGQGDVMKISEQLKMTLYNPVKTSNTDSISGDGAESSSSAIVSGNASSMVIKLEAQHYKILIMGDATGEAEQKLVDSHQDISANIYRISHHGSPSSTNHDIISAVSPQLSIISVGKNFYGHPSPEVIKRLEAADSEILRTDKNGAILLDIDNENLMINAMIP